MMQPAYREGARAALTRFGLEKLAYGFEEHRAIAAQALPGLAGQAASVHPDIARRYTRGSTTIDTALRGTHPWLGAVSPDVAAQHAFRMAPGTAGRRIVGQNILQRHRAGIDDLARGMAASQPELVRQGLHTLGGANHTMADLSSHFERGLDSAPITQGRSGLLGRAANRALPAHTAATAEQLIAHTTGSPDIITGDPLDQLAMRRAAGHGSAVRHQTIRRLVADYGLEPSAAEKLFDAHMQRGVPTGPTSGGVRRALQAVEGAVDPAALVDAARKPQALPEALRTSGRRLGEVASEYARGLSETSPMVRSVMRRVVGR